MSRCTPAVAASAGLATVVASLAFGAPAVASRTVSETYTVPANGTLRLTGHGYGHGHGMSQYGAQGAALKGLTHQQILAFYYPGTTLATITGPIRVLISADTDSDVRVLPASGLKVRDVSSGATYTLPTTAGVQTWRLRTTASGATVLDYEKSGWHVYRPGGASLTGEAEFFRAGALTLRVGGGTRSYRGAMRLAAKDTVNVLSLDEYVQGVVPREMPVSWKPAAVQAQAVAARTYATFDRAAHPSRHYDTCDTTSCQVYGGVGDEDPRGNAAVAATASRVLTYGGKPAFTQFASSSGGWLLAGSQPYLVSKADPYDNFSGNPMHTWTNTVTRAAIQRVWPSLGTLKRVLVTQRDGNGDWYGRVEKLRLDGSRSDVTVSGSSFRSTFGLRSSWFRFGNATTSEPAPAPVPAPAPDPGASPPASSKAASPIYKRWKRIGGADSVVGMPRAREYAVAGGLARRFAHGRIFYKAGAGPHELHGKVLRAYVRRGGATSRLGFPRTKPMRSGRGWFARFEHGVISVRGNGKVRVTYSG